MGLVRGAGAGDLADGNSGQASSISASNIRATTEIVVALQIPEAVFRAGLAVLT
jgi:hypothetical protein